ncbi:MAG TPA: TrbC/VirB2 family protein [Thermomicrobiales bacterium]|nr:TrbC/VirB2 family protein [Thermomicrobiales bacterium]
MLLVPLATNPMGQFFVNVYNTLLVPPLVAVGVVCFAAAALQFLIGHREGSERLLRVAVGLFLIAFAPTIVALLWDALTSAGGGLATYTPGR